MAFYDDPTGQTKYDSGVVFYDAVSPVPAGRKKLKITLNLAQKKNSGSHRIVPPGGAEADGQCEIHHTGPAPPGHHDGGHGCGNGQHGL